jgi:nitrogen PTS system EIIA component
MPFITQRFTMPFSNLLTTGAVHLGLKAANKRALLSDIAEAGATLSGLPSRQVFDALLQRERLGSTGIGAGIAIPHAKFETLDRLHGLFFQLEKPIDFEALDSQPIDLAFVLLAPETAGADHLKGLARVARVLRDPNNTRDIRATRDPAFVVQLFAASSTPQAA